MPFLTRFLGGGDASISRAKRPQELRANWSRSTKEGLDWLRRPPSAKAPSLYRVLLGLGNFVLYRVCAIKVEIEGRENLPAGGGYILAAALHRGWIDPLIPLRALPIEPRIWFLGSAPTAFDKPWKERLLRKTGGILPVWRGGGIDVHVRAAKGVMDEKAVLCLFIEGAIVGPPDRVWPGVRGGSGLLALRTRAPIVPFALTGTDELYRGKRIAAKILPPVSMAKLLGAEWPGEPPKQDTREELHLARRVTRLIADRIDAELPAMLARVTDPPDTRRRWSGLTRLMR
jgi:1-acyl-sn-glycerol-3-phosphate acyltransferase